MVPVYKICLPEYHVREKPNWKKLGAKIDKKLKRHFMGKRVVIRCIGSQEHPGKSIDDQQITQRLDGTHAIHKKFLREYNPIYAT